MASYGTRKKVIQRFEWYVPIYDRGACWTEVEKALTAAAREYRIQRGWAEGVGLSDDAILFSCGDDEILIWFEIES